MTFVDHLKNVRGEDLVLEVAFGRHMIAGDLTKSIVTGTHPTHIVTIQHMLGDAYGRGWIGPVALWFRGNYRPPNKRVFYPGLISTGPSDPNQGIDAVFDEDTPHSNTAWIRVECPSGSEDSIPEFDTLNNPPLGLAGIYDCQAGFRYDENGDPEDEDLLTNPSEVIAFGLKIIREFPDSRIDWPSLFALRQLCDEAENTDYLAILPTGVGLRGRYFNSNDFTAFVRERVDPVIQYDESNGAPEIGLDPTKFSVRWTGHIKFNYDEKYTLYLTHNEVGRLWIDDLGTPLIDESSSGTHDAEFTPVAGDFYDIKLEWINNSGNSEYLFEWESASQPRQAVPQDALFPSDETVTKYACHVAFTQRTGFDDFLRQILFTCSGAWQDANGKLKFFSLPDREPTYHFDETNIKKGTFQFSHRYSQQDMQQLPNRFIAEGRDLESRYLEKFDPPLFVDVQDMQEIAGRVIEETVSIGNAKRWHGHKMLSHHAFLKTRQIVCEFEGTPATLGVLPGDLVTVSHPLSGWENEAFLVIEAADKSVGRGADERLFRLLGLSEQIEPPPPPFDPLTAFDWLAYYDSTLITGLSNDDYISSWLNSGTAGNLVATGVGG